MRFWNKLWRGSWSWRTAMKWTRRIRQRIKWNVDIIYDFFSFFSEKNSCAKKSNKNEQKHSNMWIVINNFFNCFFDSSKLSSKPSPNVCLGSTNGLYLKGFLFICCDKAVGFGDAPVSYGQETKKGKFAKHLKTHSFIAVILTSRKQSK